VLSYASQLHLVIGDETRPVVDQSQGEVRFSCSGRTAEQDGTTIDRDRGGMDQ